MGFLKVVREPIPAHVHSRFNDSLFQLYLKFTVLPSNHHGQGSEQDVTHDATSSIVMSGHYEVTCA